MTTDQHRTWVFIRGLTREAEHWGTFLDFFRQTFPNDQIICPDLPGTGVNWQGTSPTSIPEMTMALRRSVYEVVPTDRRIHLLAVSLGGMVASEWIAQDPDHIEAVVVMNSSSKGLSPIYKRLRVKTFFRLLFLTFAPNVERREKVILARTSNNEQARAQAHASWVSIQKNRPISKRNALRQMYAASKYRIKKIPASVRALVYASHKDRLVNVSCSEDLRNYWNCDLIYHPTAGHDLALDDPEWLCRSVKDWLDLHSLPRSA